MSRFSLVRFRIVSLVVVLAAIGLVRQGLAAELGKADLYVAPNGNDAFSGKLAGPNAAGTDGPLASMQAARDAVRTLRAQRPGRPIRVLVRGGVYRVSEPIVFTADDSGSAEAPIAYAAFPGEKPIFSGGVPIEGWECDQEGRWNTTVPGAKEGTWHFRQLFVNERRATVARSPNEDTFRSAGPGVAYDNRSQAQSDQTTKISIHYQNDDLKEWPDVDQAVVVVFHSWTASRHRIKSLDPTAHLVTFTAPSGWPMGYWEKNQRYYVENVRAALDAPGEWYLDRKTGVLSYFPLPDEDAATAKVVAPVAREVLRLEGDPAGGKFLDHLTFEGLSFQHTSWHMPEAETVDGQAAAALKSATVYVRGARHCTFRRCEIAHTGGYGLWLQLGCKDNLLEQCHLHDLGAGAVRIGETNLPEEPGVQTQRNTVTSCFLHDGGNVYHAGVGVWIGKSSFNQVTHNEICDFYYTGVSVGWSWGYAASSANHNVIEKNHIHHLGWGALSDMGGIYCLGVSPGTVLRGNVIHDVLSYAYGGWGLYTDEGSSEIVLENNIVYRVKDGAFHQHYGRENMVRNNVLALAATYGQIRRSREEDHRSFTVERNIIYSNGVPMLGGNWSNGNFRLDHNCYFDASGTAPAFPEDRDFAKWQAAGHDRHSLVADPKFVDPEHADFQLQPDSPALKLGFKPIDTRDVGLVGPQDWRKLPEKYPLPKIVLPGEE